MGVRLLGMERSFKDIQYNVFLGVWTGHMLHVDIDSCVQNHCCTYVETAFSEYNEMSNCRLY